MANTKVFEDLEAVEYYTALDPYYYTVDNRPIQNLDNNVQLVAQAVDDFTGGANRSALAAASAGYALTGAGNSLYGPGSYIGDYSYVGFSLTHAYGFGTWLILDGARGIEVPNLAVHDQADTFQMIPPPSNAQDATYFVLATRRAPTASDFVPTANSPIWVLEIASQVTYHAVGTSPTPPALDGSTIILMAVTVPFGAASLDDATISLYNMKTTAQTSDISQSTVKYNTQIVTVPAGSSNVPIQVGGGADPIDLTDPGSIEVFLQGVNQFDWTADAAAGSITLSEVVSTGDSQAAVRVRQATLSLR